MMLEHCRATDMVYFFGSVVMLLASLINHVWSLQFGHGWCIFGLSIAVSKLFQVRHSLPQQHSLYRRHASATGSQQL